MSARSICIFLFAVAATLACRADDEGESSVPQHPTPEGSATERPQESAVAGAAHVSALSFPAQEGWIEEEPQNSMRAAQFRLPAVEGDATDASLVVYYFKGGGSWEANVERWCGQFEQPDGRASMDAAVISTRKVAGLDARELELSGTYVAETAPGSQEFVHETEWSMIAGVINGPEGSWYPKLVGPARTVAHWKPSYRRFLGALTALD